MIDDTLLQNWSTLHSPLIDLYRKAFRESSPTEPDGPSWRKAKEPETLVSRQPALLHRADCHCVFATEFPVFGDCF
jgi:hypothetical protein